MIHCNMIHRNMINYGTDFKTGHTDIATQTVIGFFE